MRKLLVAAQMALSVVLLVSAGLLMRSFVNLQNVDIGFDAENLFSAQLSLPRGQVRAPTSRECSPSSCSMVSLDRPASPRRRRLTLPPNT